MNASHDILARILNTKPQVLADLERRMNALTGQVGVLDDIVQQNAIAVEQTLSKLGLARDADAATVRGALLEQLRVLDARLFDLLGKPDLAKVTATCGLLCQTALRVFTPPKGLFLKHDKVAAMLQQHPPENILEQLGYSSIPELLEKEGYASVMAALRFTQTTEWMHQFFEVAYSGVKPEDFEERDVQLMVLDTKWLVVAEKFIQHKRHNVSHLKEFGVIFVTPIPLDLPGETMRMFTLILHYLHEVPFYASLFRQHLSDADFPSVLKSLLRGDVPSEQLPPTKSGEIVVRIIQRYLTKDDANDFRLAEPHVNPEADHWWRAEQDFARLSRMMGEDAHGVPISWWAGLDFVGEELVSFDFIDLIMSLAQETTGSYVYHQQEALWNKIFIEYLGRERMRELMEANLLTGFIKLP